MPNYSNILKETIKIFKQTQSTQVALKKVCKYLKENIPHYDWVGFYFVNSEKKDELVLGPFEGEPTEHVRIKFGQGICGQAAIRKDIIVVQDVSKETNYLSCSSKVKSEIVVPIFKNGKLIGELDIDSHKLSPFTKEDEKFLNTIVNIISDFL